MNLPDLITKFPALVFLGLAVAFSLAFSFRSKQWVLFIWIPLSALFAYAALSVLSEVLATARVKGPDAGFAAMANIILLPALGICIVGLILCFFARPRAEVWRPWNAISASALWLVVALFSDRENATRVDLEFFNSAGQKSPSDAIITLHRNGLKVREQTEDASDGRLSYTFHRHESIGFEIRPKDFQRMNKEMPVFWNIDVDALRESPDQLVIRRGWQRSLGGQTLNEGFTEVVPFTHHLQLREIIPARESLECEAIREKLRAQLAKFETSIPPGLNYSYICRNAESVEFAPQLIEIYRQNEKQRASALEGLATVAGMFSEIQHGFREVQKRSQPRGTYAPDMIAYKADEFSRWAGQEILPNESKLDALEKVKAVIDARAQLLIDFVFAEALNNEEALKILEALRQAGHPALSRLVNLVAENPPATMGSSYRWSHTLWSIGAHFEDLQPLVNSDNPLLVMIAFEATPNDQMEGSVAATMLPRLQAIRSGLDPKDAPRADMHIKMLQARLEHPRKR